MGLIIGIVKRLLKLFVYFLIFAAIIVLIPNLPPYTKFTSISIEPTQPRTGALAPNNALNNAEKAYVDKLLGPEAFQLYKGDLYTSLATGEIVKISPGGHVTFVTKIGQPCSGLTYEHICGRPLGFQIDESNDIMYVADAYHGIWKVYLQNDKKQLLVSPRVAVEGREPKLLNSIALCKNGDFYWTDSTSDFLLKDGAMSVLTDPSGRLLHYNAAKNQSKVLLDDLWFANGLVISPDNQFLIVAETSRFRLLKYYIDGPKKGKSEVFVAGLPGLPDNVRALPDGSGILVGLYTTVDEENPLLVRPLAAAPLARKFLARLQRLVEIPFEYLNTVYPHVILEEIVYNIGHFKTMSGFVPKMSGLVQIDWTGNIIASYYNNDGSLGHISDAVVFNGKLHTGSPHGQNFIGIVTAPPLLKKAFETKPESAPKQTKPVEAPKEVKKDVPKPAAQPKPAQQQAKPVETPKPTPKPAEQPKPTPKPVEQPKSTPKPEPKATPKPEQPKATPKSEQPKPTPKPEQPKAAQPKPTTPPPPKTVPPKVQPKQEKPEVKAPPTPKPAPKVEPTKTAPEAKPVPAKPAESKPQGKKPKDSQKPVKEQPKPSAQPEQIPIKEEIPSDTAKPSKETLKVIKKGGPTEIPNPHL